MIASDCSIVQETSEDKLKACLLSKEETQKQLVN